MRVHVVPVLGSVPLAKVTPQHLSDLYGLKLESLSARSVEQMHAVLHRAQKVVPKQGLEP